MSKMIACLILVFMAVTINGLEECVHKDFGNGGTVCVCNENHCDDIPSLKPVPKENFLLYTSNKAGLRFKNLTGSFKTNVEAETTTTITIDRNQKYQQINGFGGAFTDAFGINLISLNEKARANLMKSYFSENGIEYSLCRVPIGGTDFSTHGYSYDDGEEDLELKNFKLVPEDFKYKLPFIKEASSLTDNKLQFFASAWTAPKWMKTNGEYSGFGFLKKEMYQSWANYFVKFLEHYEKEGVNFWGLTTGNEPSLGLVGSKINSVGWLSNEMRKFISENLGPTLRASKFSTIKLMALDDQRLFLPWYINSLFKNNLTKNFVDGIAVHWYWNGIFPPSLLSRTHDNYPEKFILATEACKGDKPFEKHVELGSWQRGEDYVADIIENLQNWATGWIDWNMALDVIGGPTYIDNRVDSPIIVNATGKEFYKQPMFYGLGHFSKFVPKNSVRIGSTQSNGNVLSVALERPDNGTVIVILNRNNHNIKTSIIDERRGTINIDATAKSFTTVIYW